MRLGFESVDDTVFEIHLEGKAPRTISYADLRALAGTELPKKPDAMEALGRRAFAFLSGPEGWLDGLAANSVLEFDCARIPEAAGVAWELLHDDAGYLARRGVVAVRAMRREAAADPEPANRPLRLLFMACSPTNVRPVLDFEAEERIILKATAKKPISLVPEETGFLEELKETAGRYGSGGIDAFHLTGHGNLYNKKLHGGYLGEDQSLKEGEPVFLTENDRGRCRLAAADDFERVFGAEVPGLAFLSGCKTAQEQTDGDGGGSLSFARALVAKGFPAVLGWALPVGDTAATRAAEFFYGALAEGRTIEDALRVTLREGTRLDANGRFTIPDWHLLRLFVAARRRRGLVTPLSHKGRAKAEAVRVGDDFLDPATRKVKVAGGDRFVGRRRPLQRCLPAFDASGEHVGVVVWGLGGLGKSSLAARLLDRMARKRGFEQAVVVGVLSEARLMAALREKVQRVPAALGALADGRIPLQGRLEAFFEAVGPMAVVLDDFEKNAAVDAGQTAGFRVEPAAYAVVEALCKAIRRTGTESRLVVTTRYFDERVFPAGPWLTEQLPEMEFTELEKKWRVDYPKELGDGAETVKAALGNPRLFEQLGPEAAEAEEKQRRFAEGLELGAAMGALGAGERDGVARLAVYRLAVGPELVEAVAAGADFGRAVGLGLVERGEGEAEGSGTLRVTDLCRPLVDGVLAGAEREGVFGAAARAAHRVWWEEVDRVEETRMVEVVRLAREGGERAIACDRAQWLIGGWIRVSRYREAAALGGSVLEVFEDARLLARVGEAEKTLGLTASAEARLRRSLELQGAGDSWARAHALYERAHLAVQQGRVAEAEELYRDCYEMDGRLGNEQGQAATLHAMAGVRRRQGDVAGAMALYEQSLAMKERIGDVQGQAATLHQMAEVRRQQGDVAGAMALYEQSLAMNEQIGDVQGQAATLHQMAGVRLQQGDVAGAMALYEQSLAMNEQIGDVQGQAATLHQMAGVRRQQGDVAGAMALYEQSLAMKERIGNVQGQAATLHEMVGVRLQQGDVAGAMALYEQSLAMKERIGDVQGQAAALHAMAGVRLRQGDVAGAMALNEQSLAMQERLGDVQGQAATLHQMAGVREQQGDVAGAMALYEQSLAMEERIGNVQGQAATLANLAAIAHAAGDGAKAVAYTRRSAGLMAGAGAYSDLVTVVGNLAVVDEASRTPLMTQAVWLAAAMGHRDLGALAEWAFHRAPAGDALETTLAEVRLLAAMRQGDDREGLEKAGELAGIAAGNRGMSQEQYDRWMQDLVANAADRWGRALAALERSVPGDAWVFDREAVKKALGLGAKGAGA